MADSVTVTRRTESPTPAQRQAMAEQQRLARLPRQFWDPHYYADPRNAQLARSIGMPVLGADSLTASQFHRLQIAAQGSMISPRMVGEMLAVLDGSPLISAGTATALSQFADQAQLSQDIKDRILTLDAEARAMEADLTAARNPDQGSEAEKGGWLSRMVKGVSRPAFALLQMPLELIQGSVRRTVGLFQDEERREEWQSEHGFGAGFDANFANPFNDEAAPWKQSLGGQYIAGLYGGAPNADLGTGYIPRGDVLVRQEQAKRDAAPLVFNEHWTLGRGVGSMIFDNGDSLAFRNTSGLIDIAGAILMDPLVGLGVASSAARGTVAAERIAEGVRTGREVAAQGIEREIIELSQGTTEALQRARLVSDETLNIANQVVRDSNHLYAQAQRLAAPTQGRSALDEITGQLDDVNAQIRATQAELAATRTTRKEAPARAREEKATAQAGIEETAVWMDTDMKVAIDNLTMQLGDDGLDAMQAKVLADSPELPGAFTDAVFVPMKRTQTQAPNALPGADSGADAIVVWNSEKSPNLRSIDDAIENPDEVIAAIKSFAPKSNQRKQSIKRVTELLTRPGATYGDLLDYAARNNLGIPVQAVLKSSQIDGITDVFRLTGGEGGVWWTSADVAIARWSDEVDLGAIPTGRVPAEAYRVIDDSLAGQRARLGELRSKRKDLTSQQKVMLRRSAAEEKLMTSLANSFDTATNLRTEVADSAVAVRNALEYSMGVRRTLGGKPERSHELLKQWLIGPTREFDEILEARVPRVAEARGIQQANRGMLALTTMGVSELPAVARRIAEPFATRARQATFDLMVKLDYSPRNLGLLQRLSNGKIDPEILTAVLRARTEDEVLETLAPAVGVGITRPIGPNAINALPIRMNKITSGKSNDRVFARGADFVLDWLERAGSVAPRFGAHINFADPMGSAQVLRNYLTNLPHISNEVADDMVGRYMAKDTEVGRARALTSKGGVMDRIADELIDFNATRNHLSDQTRDILAEHLREATRVYEGGRAKVNDWWLEGYANDANMGFRTQDGQIVPYVGPQLEAELARGGVLLPSTDDIRRAVGRWGSAIEARPQLKGMIKGLDVMMDWWRSSVLFRYAYTVRNIGEMQFRMFLSGHSSVFNHPIAALGMASAMNKRTTFSKGLLGRFAKYNKTASGRDLPPVGQDDLDATENVLGEFIELMNRSGSYHDERSVRAVEMRHDVRVVQVGQPGFTKGWAEQLIKLRSDRIARIVAGQNPPGLDKVMALGIPREQAVVDWLMNAPAAAGIRREFSESESTLAQIFADPVMLNDFLFSSPASVRARIQEYTAGGQAELVDFLVTGRLTRNGKEKFSMSSYDADPAIRAELMANRASRMSAGLRDFVTDMPEDYALRMRVVVGEGRNPRNPLRRGLDAFFDWNGRKETAWSMGPEFSYAFNDAMVEMMPSLNKVDRQKIFDFVKHAEGRWRLPSEVMLQARTHAKITDDGPLLMADAEKFAAQKASEHVRNLFYDAANRKQLFHSLRLAMPFAQPFVDTLWRWGRLMAARPYMVEKFGRLGEALTNTGSGVIYDDFDWIDPFSNRDSRDPTQGFIYTDPQTGESKFTFPLVGSVLGAVLSPAAGFNVAESMTLTAPVENLNLAFQGDVDYLPGLGPLVSFPLSQIMPDDWFGTMPDWLREYAFPYGEPKPEAGLFESTFFPSWLRRLTGTMYNEEFRSYSYKGMMAYFASTKEYPGIQGSPEVQQELIDDVQAGAKWLTFIRAIGAAVLPAAPTQEIYAADRDGRLIGSTYLAAHWHHLLQESGNDYEASTKAFMDTYGMQALAAILPSSEGEFAISGPGWEWFKKHPGQSDAFSDVIGYFFPGDFSLDAYSFQQGSGDRETLSVEDRTERMVQFLYDAEKSQLEGRAARELWDVTQIEDAEADLKMRYGGVIPAFTGVDSRTRLDQIRRAVEQFDDLANTRAGQGAQLLFEAYDTFSEQSEYLYGSGLASEKAEGLREEFLREIDTVAQEYGGWNETEGSITSIARLFVNVVTPKGE